MISRFLTTLSLSIMFLSAALAQTVLNANGPGNTYELINSTLALGATAIETPDQTAGTHIAFGRHITEIFDTELNKNVFEFYIHVADDNDVTGGSARQRVEMKTYGPSPANLKGTVGETVVYKWRFKIPIGFQPSLTFTHIHQVKAVDGDDGDPIFTLTPRKGTPNKSELIYVKDQNSSLDKKVTVNLSLFEGIWVEATETIKIGVNGNYTMSIVKVSDGTSVLSYTNSDIQTIRSDNSFIRPKWGIYRSLATPTDLRDESIRFSDISINKLSALPVSITSFNALKQTTGIKLIWNTASEKNNSYFEIERSSDGVQFASIGKVNGTGSSNKSLDYYFTDKSPASGVNYYRLNQMDYDGQTSLSKVVSVNTGISNSSIQVYTSANSANINISISTEQASSGQLVIYNTSGQKFYEKVISLNKGSNNFSISLSNTDKGIFIATYNSASQILKRKFVK